MTSIQTTTTSPSEDRFKSERLSGIGGSDVGAVFSLDRGCARRLWYEKRQTKPDFPDPYRPEYERGTDLEPIAVAKYEKRTGTKVLVTDKCYRSRAHQHMICHVDGIVSQTGLLEVKVINQWHLKKLKKYGMPESYILQMQHGLYVTGLRWGQWAILCPDPYELFILAPTKPDTELIQKIIAAEDEFWAMVRNGPSPDKLSPEDPRCQTCVFRKTCQGSEMLEAIPKTERTTFLESDPKLDNLAQEYFEAKDLQRQADELVQISTDAIKSAIGERAGVKTTGARFLLNKSWPSRWDTAALKASLDVFPLLEDYLKKTPQDQPQLTLRGYRTND